MIMLLQNLKNKFLESIHEFLWRQWSVLGVPGYSGDDDPWIIDPEALLLFSLTFNRYESRLFDETMNWLETYGYMINIQRIKRIQTNEAISSQQLLSAVAAVMSDKGKTSKWRRLASEMQTPDKQQNLFLNKNGTHSIHFGKTDPKFEKYGFLRGPYQSRQHIQSIQILKHQGLSFRLRALLGINARVEIILYLLTHKKGHPRKIARECYYFQKTVQDALVEMAGSGILKISQQGKEKHYRLLHEDWYQLLKIFKPDPIWINWPLLFSALENIWLKISDPEFQNLNELLQSSELRQLVKSNRAKIEMSEMGLFLTDDSHYLGKEYTKIFVQDINKILEKLNNPNK